MQISTKKILRILYLLSWVIFVGACIEAGGFIFNTFFTLSVKPVDAAHFWTGVDLSSLYAYGRWHFFTETMNMIIAALMRACLFYLIIKILHDKKLNLAQPFNKDLERFTFKIAYLSLFIGLFSWWGAKYTGWLMSQGVKMPDLQYLRLGGADVWLLMSVVLYVIAQIFKRGIEIQTENELTV